MTSPSCRICISWDTNDQHTVGGIPDLGTCTRAKMFWNSTVWVDDDRMIKRAFKPEAEGDLMFVQDGSDYSADLITRGSFHCASFAEKVSK